MGVESNQGNMKPSKKKKNKKDPSDVPKRFHALAELTSSDIVQQVKMGMSKIAPLDSDVEAEEPAP